MKAVREGTPVDMKRLDVAKKFSEELQEIQNLLVTVEKEFGHMDNVRQYNRDCKKLQSDKHQRDRESNQPSRPDNFSTFIEAVNETEVRPQT